MKRPSVGAETTFATVGVLDISAGLGMHGPWQLKILCLVCGTVLVALAFHQIFSVIHTRWCLLDDGPDGGPDGDGEPMVFASTPMIVVDARCDRGVVRREISEIVKFPRAA